MQENADHNGNDDLKIQAEGIASGLKASGIEIPADKQVIALIAYLQRLGTDIMASPGTQIK